MALTRTQKEQLVQEYGERLGRAQVLIWSTYSGLSVAESTKLRRQLYNVESEAVVVKNTLFGLALQDAGIEIAEELANGVNMVTFVYGDIAPAAKAVLDFDSARREAFSVKGGVIGTKTASLEQIRALRDLPSQEQLLAMVVGGIQAPISGFVNVLAGTVRGVVNVLKAYADKLEEEGSAA